MPVELTVVLTRQQTGALGGKAGRGKAKRRGDAAYYRRIGLKGLRRRWKKGKRT